MFKKYTQDMLYYSTYIIINAFIQLYFNHITVLYVFYTSVDYVNTFIS